MSELLPEQPDMLQIFWQDVLKLFRHSLPAEQFKTWVEPLGFGLIREQYVIVYAPNRFKLDYARQQLLPQLEKLAMNVWGRAMPFQFCIAAKHQQTEISARLEANATQGDRIQSKIENQNSPNEGLLSNTDQSSIKPKRGRPSQKSNHELDSSQSALFDDLFSQNIFQDTFTRAIASANNPKTRTAQNNHACRLNPQLTFDNFVHGEANALARSAAFQLSLDEKRLYNPCYIYGDVGLGKTHLMHAIGNHAKNTNAHTQVRYIHAEQFVSDVVKSYQRKSYEDLKANYHSLDILLIDDIQFLGGKTRTQEEFFHMFEFLLNKKAQIILTGDCYPKQLKDMDSRLVSRFTSGLIVTIHPPELKMRIDILKTKALVEDFPLSHEVAFFIAQYFEHNVRELEGALRKYMAYHLFHQDIKPSVDSAREALKDLAPQMLDVDQTSSNLEKLEEKSQISHISSFAKSSNYLDIDAKSLGQQLANLKKNTAQKVLEVQDDTYPKPSTHLIFLIQTTVGDFYGLSVEDIVSRKRSNILTKPRQIAMFLAKELSQLSFMEIGKAFAGRDHTTILHAYKKIQTEEKTQEDLQQEIESIRQSIAFKNKKLKKS